MVHHSAALDTGIFNDGVDRLFYFPIIYCFRNFNLLVTGPFYQHILQSVLIFYIHSTLVKFKYKGDQVSGIRAFRVPL